MNRQRLFFMLYHIFILFLLIMNGCSKSILPIDKNAPLPPIVKTYKHTVIPAGISGMRNTGVFIEKGDTYTILASGSMDFCLRGACNYRDVKPEDGWPIIARIGKEGLIFTPLRKGWNGNTDVRYDSGYLFLGYRGGKVDWYGTAWNPEYYSDDTGSFSVDVIVWKKDDYVQIAAFLEKMKKRDPDNKAIHDALSYANMRKNLFLAEVETSKEVDETKKMIQKLKVEGTPTADRTDQKKVEELETKLSKLMSTLAQLDKMKKQLEEEKKKTAQLSQELEEKDERERALLSKIEDGSKNPPVIVIATPTDGQKTEGKIIQLSGVAEDDKGLERLEILIDAKMLSTRSARGVKIAERESFPKRLNFSEQT